MRIVNDHMTNPHPISGTDQPELFWGTDRPSDGSTFTSKPTGTVYIAKPATGLIETWVRVLDSTDDIHDWSCVRGVLVQRISIADFTDGGSTVGTLVLTPDLPAGAFVLGSQVRAVVGWAGDTSAIMTIGDGTDVDRYNTGSYNVFATAAYGADGDTENPPSGNRGHLAAMTTLTVTVTTGADFTTAKSNGSGRATVYIFYVV
jgi:hypothetical protein